MVDIDKLKKRVEDAKIEAAKTEERLEQAKKELVRIKEEVSKAGCTIKELPDKIKELDKEIVAEVEKIEGVLNAIGDIKAGIEEPDEAEADLFGDI